VHVGVCPLVCMCVCKGMHWYVCVYESVSWWVSRARCTAIVASHPFPLIALSLPLPVLDRSWGSWPSSHVAQPSPSAFAAMPSNPAHIRRRLTRKTTVTAQGAQEPADVEDELGSKAHRQVYLVTLPHPKQAVSGEGFRLVAPDTLTKGQVLQRFLDCLREPLYVDGRSLAMGGHGVQVLRAGVWRELHKQGSGNDMPRAHDHLPVLAAKQFRYLPVKRALLQRFGLASHWSCTHTGYWSAVRYLTMPSPAKPMLALDRCPLLWDASGPHPPLDECCHEPLTAAALRKRRLHAEAAAAEEGKAEPKVTELDVWPIVVKEGFRNTPDAAYAHLELIAFAKTHTSSAMQRFLFKHRQRLPSLIDDIWRWETVEDSLEQARLTRLRVLEVAFEKQCVCRGEWLSNVHKVFANNCIPVGDVCRDVYLALSAGRSERTPVVVFSGLRGGEGKSFFLKGLSSCYGHDYVFPSPQKGNFPLLDLPGKKVVFLDDWRFDGSVVPFATQCLWYDGSVFPIAQPQNQPGKLGHILYRGTAPIFATTKSDDMQQLVAAGTPNPQSGVPLDANASMVLRRLKLYFFTIPMTKPTHAVPYCARCFAGLILSHKG